MWISSFDRSSILRIDWKKVKQPFSIITGWLLFSCSVFPFIWLSYALIMYCFPSVTKNIKSLVQQLRRNIISRCSADDVRSQPELEAALAYLRKRS